MLSGLGEVVLDAGAGGLANERQGAGVQAGRALPPGGGEFLVGPLPVGRAVGVEGVRGLAGLVEVGDGERAGLGSGHAAGQLDAGVAEAGTEEGAEDISGEAPEERVGVPSRARTTAVLAGPPPGRAHGASWSEPDRAG